MTREAFAELLVNLLFPVFLAAGGYLLTLIRRMHINGVVLTAIGNAAGAAYTELVKNGQGATPLTIDAAVQQGVRYVMDRTPDYAVKAGFTANSQLAGAVSAQLGKLLAADPSVGPSGPVERPAP